VSEKLTLEERAVKISWGVEGAQGERAAIEQRALRHLRAVQAETREECARIAETLHPGCEGEEIAAAIREENR